MHNSISYYRNRCSMVKTKSQDALHDCNEQTRYWLVPRFKEDANEYQHHHHPPRGMYAKTSITLSESAARNSSSLSGKRTFRKAGRLTQGRRKDRLQG